uniref:ATP synthase subunit a n=1 Tax=Acerella muscorum TaxID=187596 RepID=A0A0C4K5K5_9HEXA|nr:ATP synthase F0 subunit 6 [Acerella muscorum]AHL42969.1 ATP synthase F0 subunit 6 [Acerella muscorum]
MNLFSIFDPLSYFKLSLNWMSLGFIFFPISFCFWINSSKKFILMNNIIIYLNNEMKVLLKNKVLGKTLFFICIMMFILMNNFMGLYPYMFTFTSHLTLTLTLALPLWLSSVMYGWVNNFIKMLSHMIPMSTSLVLMPFMSCIELMSIIIRPMTLSIRLATNMIAGHLLLTLLSNSSYYNEKIYMKFIIIMIQVLLLLLELGVALVQSYVFSTLSILYNSESN